jgi:hypothetical protein
VMAAGRPGLPTPASSTLSTANHPDRPDQQPAPGLEPRPGRQHATSAAAIAPRPGTGASRSGRRSADPAHDQARELISQLQQGSGTITVESPDEATRARYRRAIHAAKQYQLVPAGLHLRHTGRARGDLIIRLSGDGADEETDWNRIRLNTRRVTSDPALITAALENDPAALDVTSALLPRALTLILRLAQESDRQGCRLTISTKTVHPKLHLHTGGFQRSVTVREEYDEIPHVPTDQERRELRRQPWHHLPETDRVPSGRLRLEIGRSGWGSHDSWADSKRALLDKQLPQIIRDVKAGAAADEEAHQAARRAHDAYLAEQQRQEQEQLRQWQAALEAARPQATEAMRAAAFRAAYDAWVAATEIRTFCDALENTPLAAGRQDGRQAWIAWGRAAADRIDPARADGPLTGESFDVVPGPDDLRPFLGDWSPDQPRRVYRPSHDPQPPAATPNDAIAWHPGMRGRPSWWRHH